MMRAAFERLSGMTALHLWTPPLRKGKRWGRCGAWSDAVICPAFDAAGKTAAGLYGSSRTGSKSPKACSKHSGKPWLSRPRLADCCAILSFRSPHALAIVVSLRRHGRSSVGATLDQQGPEPPRLSESWASLPLFFDYMGVRYS